VNYYNVICFQDCGIVPTISNGGYTLEDEGVTTFGAMATVTCDEGYESDSNAITCLENGQWSSVICTVKGKHYVLFSFDIDFLINAV
jgi:hypothetical protein